MCVLAKAHELAKETVFSQEPEHLEHLHSDHYKLRIDQEYAIRDYVVDYFAETTGVSIDDMGEIWIVFVAVMYYNVDWNGIAGIVDSVVDDWRAENEPEDDDPNYDPEADRVSDEELESAAAFLDRGTQTGELRPYKPNLAEGDRVTMVTLSGEAMGGAPGTVTVVFSHFPAVLVKFDDQDQAVRFIWFNGQYQDRYARHILKKVENAS